MGKFFLLLFCLFGTGISAKISSEILHARIGDISGISLESVHGVPYTSFLGIPYAQPPAGSLLFKKPVPALPWNGTFSADQAISCMQLAMDPSLGMFGQVDCLVLNVHTANVFNNQEELKPVMVFIHGGGFKAGSGVMGAQRFLDHDIVLVTINYRLGAMGFLSTGDDVIPGNLGLWDQNLALKWIQDNIADFGGDPTKVTIFGESAGSMCVSYHVLSLQSSGLFRAAIGESGTATTTHITSEHPPIHYARKLSERLGCRTDATSEEILECLKQVDPVEIIKAQSMFETLELLPLVFKPVVDNFTSDPFVPKNPWQIIETGEFNHVPVIVGANHDEGLFSALRYVSNSVWMEDLSSKWEAEYGPLTIFHRSVDTLDDKILELTKEVNDHFFPGIGKPTSENVLAGYLNIFSDVNFNAMGTVYARKLAEKNSAPVYEYLYNYMGSFGFTEFLMLPEWKKQLKIWGQSVGLNLFPPQYGVAHGDELNLLFKSDFPPLETVFTLEDKITSKNLLKLWTDFAKTGNPTPNPEEIGIHWQSLSTENWNQLQIGSGTLEMGLDPNLEERVKFWMNIWSRIYF